MFEARAAALAAYTRRYEPIWRGSRKFRDLLDHEQRCEIFEIVIEILSDPAVDKDPKPVADAVFERRRVISDDRETVWYYLRRWPKYLKQFTGVKQLELF